MAQSLRARDLSWAPKHQCKNKKIKIRVPPHTPLASFLSVWTLPPWPLTVLAPGWPPHLAGLRSGSAHFSICPCAAELFLKKKYSYLVCFLTPPGRRVRANGFGVCWWAPSTASSQLDAQETFVFWHFGPRPAWGWGQGTVCLPGTALLRISDERVKQEREAIRTSVPAEEEIKFWALA